MGLFPSSPLPWLLLPVLAQGPYVPPPDPGPNAACPQDMRLIEGDHYDEMEKLCIDVRGAKLPRCWGYVPDVSAMQGELTLVKVCMDVFEAPNLPGSKPFVMKTFHDAQRWCQAKGRRLCTEQEFETACEGRDLRPYFYGWSVDPTVCNTDKPGRAFDADALKAGGDAMTREVARLWQGWASGEGTRCRTREGIHDLLGNVEEWVVARKGRTYKGTLMGGWWSKPWVGCRSVNEAHFTQFASYQVGFRCCADPKG